MGLKDLQRRLKGLWVRQLLTGAAAAARKRIENENGKRASWIMPVTHGYHVVEEEDDSEEEDHGCRRFRGSCPDSVVVQRKLIGEHELWLFGVSNSLIVDDVTKHIQSHFFDKMPKQEQMRKKIKETMRKAYVGVRARMRGTTGNKDEEDEEDEEEEEERRKVGSASALVIDGGTLVIGNMGEYKAVVCRDGDAYQVNRKQQQPIRRRWSRRFISGIFRMHKIRITKAMVNRHSKSSELAVGSERIDSYTEFVILASPGIWEVMKHQEAVNLIRHIEDPQEAAECLAKEALTRMSRSNISCLIIRFD